MKPSLKEQWETPPTRAFHSGQLFCGHKPYQSKWFLAIWLKRDFMGGCGHTPHNLISGLSSWKLEIKFEAYLILERFVTNFPK